MVNIGIYTNGLGYSFDEFRRLWTEADRLGFDSAWTMDNSVAPIIGHPEMPVFETFTILPALAEATNTIRFGPLVTPSGRRHPALFAKMTSVLDVISGGRLELAMGCGDHPQFFRPWGMRYPEKASERIAMLAEEIEVIKRMWTEEHASFEGKYYSINRAVNNPKPLQKPHPRIWVGLQHGRKLMPRLAAERADGFNVMFGPDEAAAEIMSIVRENCRDLGRDFGKMERSRHIQVTLTDEPYDHMAMVERQARRDKLPEDYLSNYWKAYPVYYRHVVGGTERVTEELRKQVDLGFNHLLIQFRGVEHPLGGGAEAAIASLEPFARDAMPVLRAMRR